MARLAISITHSRRVNAFTLRTKVKNEDLINITHVSSGINFQNNLSQY